MDKGVWNEEGVFFARKGYYKGKEVTVTHRDPATGQVWLEDYPLGKNPILYGCWVNGDSVSYKLETAKPKSKKRRKR